MAAAAVPAGSNLKLFLQTAAARTDTYLRSFTASLAESPPKLTEAIDYSLLGPGKRIRPALVQLCYRAAGGEDAECAPALPPAAAIEMIHCFSLIHDDLPAMDNDDLRRGRPTNHKVFGEAMAILAGDALNTLPFELLASRVSDAALATRLIRELAQATGPEGMIGGQVLDTCHPEEVRAAPAAKATMPDLQRIHRMKTGALIRCACRMGALVAASPSSSAGGSATLEAIDTYGRAIGLAFQITDDILDVTATEDQMGKKTNKDAAIGKLTYPSLVGLEKARQLLAEQVELARQTAGRLGAHGVLLSQLADELANRRS